MEKLNEKQVLTNVRLSHAQKYILAKLLLPNQTPLTAYGHVSTGKNVVANRDVLVKLGMVLVGENEAEITDKGIDAMKNANLADETGALTPEGEKYGYAKSLKDIEKIAADAQPPETPAPELGAEEPMERPPMGNASQEDKRSSSQVDFDMAMGESWSMITEMQESINEEEFLKIHSINPLK